MIVLALSIVAIVVITAFVLPRFKVFFSSLHATLPLPTRALISVANVFVDDWFVFVGVVAVIVVHLDLGRLDATGPGDP